MERVAGSPILDPVEAPAAASAKRSPEGLRQVAGLLLFMSLSHRVHFFIHIRHFDEVIRNNLGDCPSSCLKCRTKPFRSFNLVVQEQMPSLGLQVTSQVNIFSCQPYKKRFKKGFV